MGREERRKGLFQNSNRTKLKRLGLVYSDRCSELPTLKFKVGKYFLRWNRVDLQKNAGRTSDEKEQREESVVAGQGCSVARSLYQQASL